MIGRASWFNARVSDAPSRTVADDHCAWCAAPSPTGQGGLAIRACHTFLGSCHAQPLPLACETTCGYAACHAVSASVHEELEPRNDPR